MDLNEYQKQAMTTCNESRKNKDGGLVGSYFPSEIYNFDDDDDKLPLFVKMLKNRGCYIGEDGHIRRKKGTLASKLMRNGYYLTSAQYDNKMYYFMEHRVVWVWYNGNIPDNLVINHKDYDRANNRIDNLELVTQKEMLNIADVISTLLAESEAEKLISQMMKQMQLKLWHSYVGGLPSKLRCLLT